MMATIIVEILDVTCLDQVYSANQVIGATSYAIAGEHLRSGLPAPFTDIWVEKGVVRVQLTNHLNTGLDILMGTSPEVGKFESHQMETISRRGQTHTISLTRSGGAIMVVENQYTGMGNAAMVAWRENRQP